MEDAGFVPNSEHEAIPLFEIVEFKDHHFYIAAIPSINLTGYGKNSKEAREMLFKIVLPDFIETRNSRKQS